MTYSPNRDDLGELLEICDPAPRVSAEIESPQVCWRLTALEFWTWVTQGPDPCVVRLEALGRPPTVGFPRQRKPGGHRRHRYCAPCQRRLPHADQGACELAFGRKGHCKSPSTAAFSTSCSLIVPSNNVLRDETEFNTTGVGRGRRVSRVLYR